MSYLTTSVQRSLLERMRIDRRNITGDVGIEVEVEGRRLPGGIGPWQVKEDHSLRGAQGYEYVLHHPIPFEDVSKNCNELEQHFKATGAITNMSHRTSVHVHLNVTKFFWQEIYNLITLYLLFEEFLVGFSGEHRKGNVYCLRATDAEYLPLHIIQGLNTGNYLELLTGDDVRYSALNLKAIWSFGSVEFRSFRGSTKADEIIEWVDLLKRLYDLSKVYDNPLEIVKAFQDNPETLIDKVFGSTRFKEFILTYPNWFSMMHKGYQYGFEIGHANRQGWSNLKGVREERAAGKDEVFKEFSPKKKFPDFVIHEDAMVQQEGEWFERRDRALRDVTAGLIPVQPPRPRRQEATTAPTTLGGVTVPLETWNIANFGPPRAVNIFNEEDAIFDDEGRRI